jgi:hypothetical protein
MSDPKEVYGNPAGHRDFLTSANDEQFEGQHCDRKEVCEDRAAILRVARRVRPSGKYTFVWINYPSQRTALRCTTRIRRESKPRRLCSWIEQPTIPVRYWLQPLPEGFGNAARIRNQRSRRVP